MKNNHKANSTELPAADLAIGRHREIEQQEALTLHKEICRRIGTLRDSIEENISGLRDNVNEGRAIGQLILKEEEKLPGKQITFDFYKQQEDRWVDPQGRKITFLNIRNFKKIATVETEPIEDIIRVLSWRNEILDFNGVNAAGEAPGRDPVERQNPFVQLARQIPRLARLIELHVSEIESDTRFGGLAHLDKDETSLLLAKIKEARAVLDTLEKRLS